MESNKSYGCDLDPTGGRQAFSVIAERWLEQRNLRPRTRDSCSSQLAHIVATFGPVELRRIRPTDDGLIRVNPIRIKGTAVEEAVERPIPGWDDVERIAAVIHPRFAALVWVGATSGLRFGELTGLTRRHVDLDERTLRVEQALTFIRGQGATLGPPKSVAAKSPRPSTNV